MIVDLRSSKDSSEVVVIKGVIYVFNLVNIVLLNVFKIVINEVDFYVEFNYVLNKN